MMGRVGLYWHTLRHLRPIQLAGRLRMRCYRPRPDTSPAGPLRQHGGAWCAALPKPPSLSGADRLRLLNEERALSAMAGWDDPAVPLLWRYNLHYLDFLGAEQDEEAASRAEQLLLRWVAQNRPGQGTGWAPYPTSLRIVNCVKRALAGRALPAAVNDSLACQARWLAARLEYHLLGNHLFANAKALVFAGLYFAGPEAERWLARGLAILDAEFDEQILADGGHFELSPMYHALALEDVLDLVNLAQTAGGAALAAPCARWRARVAPMCHWLRAMSHPDQELGLFNDAASGIAAPLAALLAYAGRLGCETGRAPGPGATVLADSGYVRLDRGGALVLLDVARVGPAYLPGHAHADTLSFELSLLGQRVLVNSGTSEYGMGPDRQRQRASAAHNTVVVDGADSSEVWSGFRVARRARPLGLRVTDAPALTVECSHDGYLRLPGRNLHTRRWTLAPGRLVIVDYLSGSFGTAFAYLHVHPQVPIVAVAGGACELLLAGGVRARLRVDGASLRIEDSSWHPAFGVALPSQRLALRFAQPTLITTIEWNP